MVVKGIAGVDTLISVYNEDLIKAAGLCGPGRIYTLELGLPLTYVDLPAGDEQKFAYHIILNGYKRPPSFSRLRKMDGSPATGPAERLMAAEARFDAELSAKTDFWGNIR